MTLTAGAWPSGSPQLPFTHPMSPQPWLQRELIARTVETQTVEDLQSRVQPSKRGVERARAVRISFRAFLRASRRSCCCWDQNFEKTTLIRRSAYRSIKNEIANAPTRYDNNCGVLNSCRPTSIAVCSGLVTRPPISRPTPRKKVHTSPTSESARVAAVLVRTATTTPTQAATYT